jgi:hypothetical protein
MHERELDKRKKGEISMKLEMNRVWAKQEEKMFYKPEILPSTKIGNETYIKCVDLQGNSREFANKESIIDIMYDTTMIDDNRNPIISGDILKVKLRNEEEITVAIMTHKIGSLTFFDFEPRFIIPSLGIGYLLSANVYSVEKIGNIYEIPTNFGGLG